MSEQSNKSNLQEKRATIGELNRFLAALEYTPEEISSLSLQEVLEEISALGENYHLFRDKVEDQIKITRGRVVSISVYEVTERELSILENGPPSSLYLNLAISLLSLAISFLIALLTTTIASDRTFTIFVVITTISFVSGIVLLVIWYISHQSISETILRIKSRVSSD
jgi:hypothetical protein